MKWQFVIICYIFGPLSKTWRLSEIWKWKESDLGQHTDTFSDIQFLRLHSQLICILNLENILKGMYQSRKACVEQMFNIQ